MINIKEYQNEIWNLFKPEIRDNPAKAPLYLAGKLINEVSEVWEISLKYADEFLADREKAIANAKARTKDELGDVAWYIYNLCTFYNIDPNDIEPIARDSMTLTVKLTVYSGQLLGLLLKKEYHGKPVTDDQIITLVKKINSAFVGLLKDEDINIDLSDILQSNLDKLRARHGRSYDASFYTKTAN